MPQQANPSPYAKPPRRKPGQKGYQPTDKDRATVKALIGYGSTQDETAAVLGISDVTLRKYFEREIQLAVIESNAAVAQSLFKMATRGNNVAAAIFWLKVRAGWKDPLQHEMYGANGAPLMIVTGVVRDIEQDETRDRQVRQIKRLGIYDPAAGSAD
jgi:hypothetical protein